MFNWLIKHIGSAGILFIHLIIIYSGIAIVAIHVGTNQDLIDNNYYLMVGYLLFGYVLAWLLCLHDRNNERFTENLENDRKQNTSEN